MMESLRDEHPEVRKRLGSFESGFNMIIINTHYILIQYINTY